MKTTALILASVLAASGLVACDKKSTTTTETTTTTKGSPDAPAPVVVTPVAPDSSASTVTK